MYVLFCSFICPVIPPQDLPHLFKLLFIAFIFKDLLHSFYFFPNYPHIFGSSLVTTVESLTFLAVSLFTFSDSVLTAMHEK